MLCNQLHLHKIITFRTYRLIIHLTMKVCPWKKKFKKVKQWLSTIQPILAVVNITSGSVIRVSLLAKRTNNKTTKT